MKESFVKHVIIISCEQIIVLVYQVLPQKFFSPHSGHIGLNDKANIIYAKLDQDAQYDRLRTLTFFIYFFQFSVV